jgi:hypothetical protein
VNCSSVDKIGDRLHSVATTRGTGRTILIIVEVLEENKQFLLVPSKDGFDLRRFLRIRDKYLEYMESLELDILALVTEEVHHHLEVNVIRNVARHNIEVGTVQKYLAE